MMMAIAGATLGDIYMGMRENKFFLIRYEFLVFVGSLKWHILDVCFFCSCHSTHVAVMNSTVIAQMPEILELQQ